MSRILLIAFAATFVGIATGFAVSHFEHSGRQSLLKVLPDIESDEPTVDLGDDSSKRPSIRIVGPATHDFGSMSLSETRSHTFVVENIGDANLTIAFDAKSCQCTNVNIDKNVVPPGEQAKLYLEWKPKKYDLDFRQAAAFRTNDPSRREIQLAIRGMVRQMGRIDPSSVEFSPMASEQTKTVDLNVFGYRDEDFEVKSVELLHDDREHFTATILPMPEERLASEVGAIAGQIVRVEVGAGLPVGSYLQTFRIATNKPDIGPFDVSVHGAIISDIRIVARPQYYSPELNTFLLGTLSGDKVHEFDFSLLVKGMTAEEMKFAAKSIDPKGVLSCTFGDPQQLGKVVRVPAKIQVTPTTKLVNRNGTNQGSAGTIVLETTHPTVKELKIRVAFTVKGS